MSQITVIRPATGQDLYRVEASARRFCMRHGIKNCPADLWSESVWYHLAFLRDDHDDCYPRLRRLWIACIRRAFREPKANVWTKRYVGIE